MFKGNVKLISILDRILKRCNYKIYSKFLCESNIHIHKLENYRYVYKNNFSKQIWSKQLGMSLNTFRKYFDILIEEGVIVPGKDYEGKLDVYRIYNVNTDIGYFCEVHPLELKILYEDVNIKSEHIKLFLIYRSYSNQNKACYQTRESLARRIGLKQREAFLNGQSDKEFNDKTLGKIGELNAYLEGLGLITINRNTKHSNIVKCTRNNDYYISKEIEENEKNNNEKQRKKYEINRGTEDNFYEDSPF